MDGTTTSTSGHSTGARHRPGAGVAVIVGATIAATVLLAACASDDEFEVTDAWARTSPTSATAGAVYMDITVDADDRLVGVSVPAAVAGTAEIHETVMRDDPDGGAVNDGEMAMDDGDTTMNDGDMVESGMEESEGAKSGAMTMRELTDGLVLPASQTVSLEPGGHHVMLLDLTDPLETGETFDLTLEFESGESRIVSIEVRDGAP